MNVCDPGAAETMNVRKRLRAQGTTRGSGGGGGRGRELAARGRDRERFHRAQRTLMYVCSACALTNFGAWQRGAIHVIRCKVPACDLLLQVSYAATL